MQPHKKDVHDNPTYGRDVAPKPPPRNGHKNKKHLIISPDFEEICQSGGYMTPICESVEEHFPAQDNVYETINVDETRQDSVHSSVTSSHVSAGRRSVTSNGRVTPNGTVTSNGAVTSNGTVTSNGAVTSNGDVRHHNHHPQDYDNKTLANNNNNHMNGSVPTDYTENEYADMIRD